MGGNLMTLMTDAAGYKYIGKPSKLTGNSYWVSDTNYTNMQSDLYDVLHSAPYYSSNYWNSVVYSRYSYIVWKGNKSNINQSTFRLYIGQTNHIYIMTWFGTQAESLYIDSNIDIPIDYYTAFLYLLPENNGCAHYVCAEITPGVLAHAFGFSGFLENVNPNSYYSDSPQDSLVQLVIAQDSITTNTWNTSTTGYLKNHPTDPLRNSHRNLLSTGKAKYNLACVNGENPSTIFAGDFYVFDDYALLNYPYIGRIPGLLLGYDPNIQVNNIYKIASTSTGVAIDGGSPYYIAVGKYLGSTGRWVLMRIGDFTI
jgi:hypothetical protein